MKKKPEPRPEVLFSSPIVGEAVPQSASVTVTLNVKTGEMTVTSQMPK